MKTYVEESAILKLEKWRLFELLKNRIDRFPDFITGIKSIKRQNHYSPGKFLSEWKMKDGWGGLSWSQEEEFSDPNYCLTFKKVGGNFEQLEGKLELNGSNDGTRVNLALVFERAKDSTEKESRYAPDRGAKVIVHRLFRQFQRNLTRGVLKQLLEEIGIEHLEKFFGAPLPLHLKELFRKKYVLIEFNQQEIMGAIRLTPPFLKIQKMVIMNDIDAQDTLEGIGLGMGVITQADTVGHYNDLVSLALCGQLMASTAAIHLAALFPQTAPQAIEVSGIKPLMSHSKGVELWKPSNEGTAFFTESHIVKKKMQLALARTKITLANIQYGVIDELKFALLPSKVLSSATKILPTKY